MFWEESAIKRVRAEYNSMYHKYYNPKIGGSIGITYYFLLHGHFLTKCEKTE